MSSRYPHDDRRYWREGAVARALVAEASGGEAEYALLGAIRDALPGNPTLSLHVSSGSRYRAYLARPERRAASLIAAGHSRLDRRAGLSVEVSWHSVSYAGFEVELAVVPSGGRGICAIAVARGEADEDVLGELGRDLYSYCGRSSGRTLVYSNNEWREDAALEAQVAEASWDNVVLSASRKEDLRASIERFFAREAVYRAMGVSWRRGILLAGPPGTGKTMICKAAAASLPGHPFLYVRDLSGYETQEEIIADVFERARSLAPAILVFEDIDGFVDDSNRAVFLNELDGFKSNEGLLVLASSNHPERVDEALLRRPSRFDRVFHVGLPGEAERREYCEKLLERPGLLGRAGGTEGADTLAEKVARETGGFTPAYIQEAFVSAALEVAHGDGPGEADDLSFAQRFAQRLLRHVGALRAYISESKRPERLAQTRDPSGPRTGFTAQLSAPDLAPDREQCG